MPAPQIIHDLIARFERNREHYRAANYNEIDQLVYQLCGLTAE